MEDKTQVHLSINDVIFILNTKEKAFSDYPMFKVEQFTSKIKWILERHSESIIVERWLDAGIDSELLKVGAKSWQKGKIRLHFNLEFIPDELEVDTSEVNLTEVSLDDIRQKINPVN